MKTFDLAEVQTLIRSMGDLEKQYNSAAAKLAKLIGATMPAASPAASSGTATPSAGAPPADTGIRWWPGKPGPKPKDWEAQKAAYEKWAATKVAPTVIETKPETKAKPAAKKPAAKKKAAPKAKAAKKAAAKPKAKKKVAKPSEPAADPAPAAEGGAGGGDPLAI